MSQLKTVVRKHPLAIRWFHWVNFPILFCMIWSGLLIYWANPEYRIHWGGKTIDLLPQSFFKALHLNARLAEGMAWHFTLMWLFFTNGLLYVGYTIVSGQWRYLLPDRATFREAGQVLLHDLHLRRLAPEHVKYNAAQRVAYTAIIVMGAGSLITGLAIYKPIQFKAITWLCGGYEAARLEHFVLTVGYVLFFLIHVAQVFRAGWNNFQAMLTGVEVVTPATTTHEANSTTPADGTTHPTPAAHP